MSTVVVTAEVIILLGIAVAAIAFDLWLNFGPPEVTFSYLSREWARESPFWPWTMGLLAGRFFHWGQEPVLEQPMGTIGALVISFMVVAFFTWPRAWEPIRSRFGIPGTFIAGYFVGALLWPVQVVAIRFSSP